MPPTTATRNTKIDPAVVADPEMQIAAVVVPAVFRGLDLHRGQPIARSRSHRGYSALSSAAISRAPSSNT